MMEPKTNTLPPILAENLATIKDICRKNKVKHLWAFGSVLRDDFREDSDIDLLYEWDRPAIKDDEYLSNLDGFIDAIRKLFQRDIDLVYYPALRNPYFIKDVEQTKVLLYAQRQRPEEISV